MRLCFCLLPLGLSLIFAGGSPANAKDRDRDREDERSLEANKLRIEADNAYQRGDYQQVIELAGLLINKYPKDHVHIGYHFRASARIELGRQAANAKQVREGISDARQAILIAGAEYPWLHIPYLYGLSSLSEIEKRTEHADIAIKVASPLVQRPTGKNFSADDLANILYQRGLAYSARQDHKLAIADFAESIRLNPQHLAACTRRAAAHAALGQIKEAQAVYDENVKTFPDALVVYNDRGTFRRNIGDLDGAVSDFTRALEIDPDFAIGYINRGLSLLDQNEPHSAEGDFSAALKQPLAPATQGLAYRLRGTARLAQGNLPLATKDYSAALKLTPQDAETLEDRGFANFFAKDFAAAAADFTKALKLNPRLTRIVPWLFLAQARAGRGAEARAALDQTLQLKTAPTGWVAKLCTFLVDQTPESELVESANVPEQKLKDQHLCEAHFFIGQKKLLRDDKSAAESFREAVGARTFSLSAYRGARYELGDLRSPAASK